jgi:Tfp pilus assembly protein PilE
VIQENPYQPQWGLIVIVGVTVLGIAAGIAIPAYQDFVVRSRNGA